MGTSVLQVTVYTLAVFLALTAADNSVTAKIGQTFAFRDFIRGEWEISIGQGSPSEGLKLDDGEYLLMNITENNSVFTGSILKNETDTNTVSEYDNVKIEFTDPNSGLFKGTNHLGQSLETIYDFQFDIVPSGVAISMGQFRLPSGDFKPYYFIVDSWDSFTFMVMESDTKNAFWFAKRKVHIPPKTFLTKYGSTLMLVAVFAFNMFMQRKIRKVPERARPAAANTETGPRTKIE